MLGLQGCNLGAIYERFKNGETKKQDYALLHSGKTKKKKDMSFSEEELDVSGEKELVENSGSTDFDSDSDRETSDETDSAKPVGGQDPWLLKQIMKFKKEGNVRKLKQILEKEKDREKKLKG